jgi:signal recognition particle receptor subunit beta
VFVADSQPELLEENIDSLCNLHENLLEQDFDLQSLPVVIQYNKRDLPSAAPVDELRGLLNPTNVPDFEGIASKGDGVFDTLKAVAKLVLTELRKGSGGQ